jgi:D-3-phosphoglycerate dehydrogenase
LENLLSQEIMSESRTPLEDTGHNIIIYGRVFETADVLTDFHEGQPYTMIVRITSTTRKVIEPNPNLKVIVRHGADFDVLDVKHTMTTTFKFSTNRSQTVPPLQRQQYSSP